MGPAEYLRVLRRRWLVVASAVLIAVLAGTGVSIFRGGATPLQYQGTTVLLSTGSLTAGGASAGASLPTIAALATVGDVPVRAAEQLHFPGDPTLLASHIVAEGDSTTGLLHITATAPSARAANAYADAFAHQLLASLQRRQSALAGELQDRMSQTQREIDALKARLVHAGPSDTPLLQAQLDAMTQRFSAINSQYQLLIGASNGGLQIIQSAHATQISSGPLRVPRSATARLMVATILGLIAGVAMALLLERFDSRIRTKEMAEQHYGLPVLAEIPFIPARHRWPIPRQADRQSPSLDAFRLLRAGLARSVDGADDRPKSKANGQTLHGPTVLVTSAEGGEGKTTVVANLAATFAESGKRVLVLSCDLRRPTIHAALGIPNGPGLAEAVLGSNGRDILEGHIRPTALTGVSLVTSGHAGEDAAAFLGSEGMLRVVREAREKADVVILDSAPILAGSEMSELLLTVDAVLVVARSGKTESELAHRASEVLQRLGAPVVGVALNASREAVVPRIYYRPRRHGGGSA
jgi:capsular exopolysaccharide synthesis family protein